MNNLKYKFLIFVLLMLGLGACQSQPTQLKQEVGGTDPKNRVLIDTRSSFDYESFHVSGSINLNTGDFLILKNAKTQTRILDPDVNQIVERLAKKGVSPLKPVILIGEIKNSFENRKWRWLLKQLDVRDVTTSGLEEFRSQNNSLVPVPKPESMPVWTLENQIEIRSKSEKCFVNWSDSDCLF